MEKEKATKLKRFTRVQIKTHKRMQKLVNPTAEVEIHPIHHNKPDGSK